MGECMDMGDNQSSYQPLVGLQDIKEMVHLNQDSVRDILRCSTGDPDLTIIDMGRLEDMSGTNDAFNSSICSLEVTVKFNKEDKVSDTEGEDVKKDQKTFHFVIKSPPKASFIKMIHKLTKPFLNEVTWYLELLGQVSLVDPFLPPSFPGRTIPLSSQCPIVYHAHSNYYSGEAANSCAGCPWFCWVPVRQAEKGLLVMENVKKRGFVMFDKMKVLPLDHLLLALTNLAHFHGRWLAYRWLGEAGKLPEGSWSVEKFKRALDTQKRVPKFIYKQLLNGTHKTVRRILQLEGKEELVENVDKFYGVTAIQQLDNFMGAVTTQIDTCLHGDFWSNNIMYKYDEVTGVVSDTVLVDFQLINYGHPAYDLLYILYISTDRQMRDQHMDQVMSYYWDTLSLYIKEFKPDHVKYDLSDFQADIETYKTIGFVLATTLLPNVLSATQVEPGGLLALRDMQRKQAAELEDSTNEASKEIKRRVVGLVEELVRDKVI